MPRQNVGIQLYSRRDMHAADLPGTLSMLADVGYPEVESAEAFEAYPALVDQAAVLFEQLANNHPLPDANKRAAFLLTARFLDANGLATALVRQGRRRIREPAPSLASRRMPRR